MLTEQENLKNMEECPRFISCDIAKCPLDLFSEQRIELKEDPKCKMWKYYTGFKPRNSEGHYIPRLRDRIVAMGELRKKVAKTDILS